MNLECDTGKYQLLATCAFGLEALVRRELESLQYAAKVVEPGRVAFEGDSTAILRSNLWLRTADRILLKVADFPAGDFDELFESTREIDWASYISQKGQFPVNGRCIRSQLASVPACQRAIKRAIADSLSRDYQGAPLTEDGENYRIDFTILKDHATLTIDTSGVGLHRRGYHQRGSSPQVKETLAAALVLLSYWRAGRPMIDPVCKGGTVAIEAAMIGMKIAPGINRTFACEDWSPEYKKISQQIRHEASTNQIAGLDNRIIAIDSDSRVLQKARFNASLANVSECIHFECRELTEIQSQRRFGSVITLPPPEETFRSFRERDDYYRQLPELFRRLPTWSHYVLSDFRKLESLLGRKADRRRKLYSGGQSMTYYQFHGPKPVTNESPRESHQSNVANSKIREGERPDSKKKEESTEANVCQLDASSISSQPPGLEEPKNQPVYEHASGPAAFGELSAKSQEQATLFAARLRKRAKHLRRWPTKRGITCYRLYERDVPEIPLVVDVYEDAIHITEYDRPHERDIAEHANWLDLMARTAAECLSIASKNVFLKSRGRQKGKSQHDKVAETHTRKEVHEGGLKFLVNLSDYVDTGLFLDHRVTRGMVRDHAKGKSFLNLFCYTGSFTVYAADGGATQSVSVDLSKNYLDWAKANLRLNGLDGDQHRFISQDVMQFITEHHREPTYDLVVIDPPTFSNSKRTERDWTVQGQAEELLRQTLPLVNNGGVIYFSTNFRRFKFEPKDLPIAECHEISKQTVPEDFRNRRIHRCWRLVR